MNTPPPRIPHRLLSRVLEDDPAAAAILGDLHEDFAHLAARRGRVVASAWYWWAAGALALSRKMGTLLNSADAEDRRMRIRALLRTFVQDGSYALRALRRSPDFVLFTAMIIGLGVGATTSVFSVLKPLLLAPLPFSDPGSLVWIANHVEGSTDNSLSAVTSRTSNLRDFRERARSFQGLAGYNAFFDQQAFTLTGDGAPERLAGVAVTQDFLDVLGVHPLRGRNFTGQDETDDEPQQAIILTHGFWQRRFAADPSLVGRSLVLNGTARTVVGILPATFDFTSVFSPGVPVDFLLPWPINERTDGWGNTAVMVGRLRSGATPQSAQAELDAVVRTLQEEQPDRWGLGARVTPLQQHIAGPFTGALLLLAAAAGTVLLIVCVNVSSLILARSPGRAREVAVRKALGAPRGRLVRQLLMESLAVSLLGGALGAAVAWGVTGAVARSAAARIPLMNQVGVDGTALLFGFGVALLTGLVVGLAPAIHVTEGGEAGVIRASSRGNSSSRGATRLREFLVVGEVALACGLLVVGGLLVRSFDAVMDVDLGFNPDNTVAWQLNPSIGFETPDELAAATSALTDRLEQIPGVEQAGLIDALPLGRSRSWGFTVPGNPDTDQGLGLYPHIVDGGYLAAMGITLEAGRTFNASDSQESALVVMMNASAAERLFPGQSALGQSIRLWDGRLWEIVGVVHDVHHLSPETDPGIQVYFHLPQMPDFSTLDLVVRTTRPLDQTVEAVSAAMAEMDPDMPTREYWTVASTVDRALAPRRFTLGVLSGFGAAALLLAALGIYGVLAQSVAERRPEIGIRMALGASSRDVMRDVMNRTLALAGVGLVAGTMLALWGSRMVRSLLFGVGSTDLLTFGTMALLLLAAAVLAATIPAARAARIQAVQALQAN